MYFTDIVRLDSRAKAYLGSPSLIRFKDGQLLTCIDCFGPNAPAAPCGNANRSSLFLSKDGGASWKLLRHIEGAFWSNLFHHNDALYLMGTDRHFGSIVIPRSCDLGLTWTQATDSKNGLLFKGGTGKTSPSYHTSAVPILKAQGRIWRAYEDLIHTPGAKLSTHSSVDTVNSLSVMTRKTSAIIHFPTT